MNKDPEEPNDNPWDDAQENAGPKKPTKKSEQSEQPGNPWAQNEDVHHFRKPEQSNADDFFSAFIKNIKKGSSEFGGGFNGGSPNNRGSKKMAGSPPPFSGAPISKTTVIIAALIGLGLWLSTGIFRVQEGEVAVILRFGKMVDTVGPGLRYHLPAPIETEITKNVSVQNKIDSNIKAESSRNLDSFDKTLVLTGDENMVHINYTVLWKINDVSSYLFSVRNPDQTILAAAESIIREVMGQTTAREALTEKRDTISIKAQELLQKVLNHYKIGVQVISVQLQKVDPPSQVINAFNDMQASLTDGDRMRNEAEAYHFEIVPKARGESSKIVQEAEGYSREVIARAQGEADRFNAVYTEYRKSPEISRKRLYLDTMEHVLSHVQKTIIDTKAAPGMVPYLNLQSSQKADKK
jgi:membrane protease subunit HflK